MIDALNDGLAAPGDGDGSLGAVGQHLTGHLDTGSRHLADLLDLAAPLPYEAAALAGRHDKSEGDGGPGHSAGGDQIVEVLGGDNVYTARGICRDILLTSSNLLHISVNALKIDSVFPVTVTIRSGQVPSLMLIFAPL